ncbi:MAG: flagellar basal body-associated FliL family protein [Deltaproteobacteria bacterium]|nr:flagellar basal body-associated FliL family protein [Deltaproteobacteria bacterium]
MNSEEISTKTRAKNRVKARQSKGAKITLPALVRKRIFQAVMFAGGVLCVFLLVWTPRQDHSNPDAKMQPSGTEKHSAEYFLSPFFFPVARKGGKDRLVRIQFALKLMPEHAEKIEKNLTQLRSLLFKQLQIKKVEDFRDLQRLSALRREIQEVVNQRLGESIVEKVLVTQLLVF